MKWGCAQICPNRKWLILFLFIIALVLRFALISKGPYHSDALAFVFAAQQALDHSRWPMAHGHGYPLTAVLGTIAVWWGQVTGGRDPIHAVNLMSVVFSSLCVFPCYVFLKRLFDQTTAFFATAVFMFSPIFLSVSIYGNSHAPAMFFLLSAMAMLAAALDTGSVRRIAWSGFLMGLAGAARIQDMVVVLPAVISFFWFPSVRLSARIGRWQRMGIFFAVMLVTAVIFYGPGILARGKGAYYNLGFFQYQILDPFQGLFTKFLLTAVRQLADNASFPGVALAAAGAVLVIRRAPRALIFSALWLGISLLALGNLYFKAPRLLLVVTLPVCFLQGAALAGLWTAFPGRLWGKALSVILLSAVLLFSLTRILPVLFFRHEQAVTVDFARWVERMTEPDAVVIAGDEDAFISYYGRRETLASIAVFSDLVDHRPHLREEFKNYKARVDRLLADGRSVYITETGLYSNNDGLFPAFISQYYRLHFVGAHPLEPWHRSCVTLEVYPFALFKLSLPPERQVNIPSGKE